MMRTISILLLIVLLFSCKRRLTECKVEFTPVEKSYICAWNAGSIKTYSTQNGSTFDLVVYSNTVTTKCTGKSFYGATPKISNKVKICYSDIADSSENTQLYFHMRRMAHKKEAFYTFRLMDFYLSTRTLDEFYMDSITEDGIKFDSCFVLLSEKEASKVQKVYWRKKEGILGFKYKDELYYK
jgi:hypothetical protein